MEAANIGAAPGPVYISPELISGGNAPNSIATVLAGRRRVGDLGSGVRTGTGVNRIHKHFVHRSSLGPDHLIEAAMRSELRRGEWGDLVGSARRPQPPTFLAVWSRTTRALLTAPIDPGKRCV